MKRLEYGGVALVPIAVLTIRRKCLSMNEKLLFFRMVSSSSQKRSGDIKTKVTAKIEKEESLTK